MANEFGQLHKRNGKQGKRRLFIRCQIKWIHLFLYCHQTVKMEKGKQVVCPHDKGRSNNAFGAVVADFVKC
ncbi:hypothetical protein P9850_06330 [Anoxybacillus rupiensis]|uniref:Uncharacterized protein n=1 Tax=Anoxybacteroides rupiense TaxID=311460 RepID=A0ABD5IUC7_9BACL|nr:hypothetical protein [Anoxybacillus rupiensis]